MSQNGFKRIGDVAFAMTRDGVGHIAEKEPLAAIGNGLRPSKNVGSAAASDSHGPGIDNGNITQNRALAADFVL